MDKNKKEIRWGLLGAGNVLERWMSGARQVSDMNIVAVASRTRETARKAAEKYQISEALTYEELLQREDIDVVYIPVPHTAHKELAIRAMNAGKAVLVEKVAAVNTCQLQEMIACAKRNQVFFMEAVWTRFFPLAEKIRSWIAQGRIGEVRVVQATLSFRFEYSKEGRLFDPEKAGGSLLDVGVYTIQFANMILGKRPERITGFASFDTDKCHIQVDEQACIVEQFDRGELAMMSCGIRTAQKEIAYIYGSKGYIEIPHFCKLTDAKVVTEAGEEHYTIPVPQRADGMTDEGYQFEIAHVNKCLRNNRKESPIMPWDDSLAILEQCDQLRSQWGFQYPFEKNR